MSASNLPAQYRRYVEVVDEQPVTGPVELYGEREAVVWVPGAYGGMVPVRKSQAPAPVQLAVPRDLAPHPVLDPIAQRLLGAGAGGGLLLWGGGKFLAGAGDLIASLSGGGALLFFLALACARAAFSGRGGGSYVRHEQHTHVHQKWLGRTNIHNQ